MSSAELRFRRHEVGRPYLRAGAVRRRGRHRARWALPIFVGLLAASIGSDARAAAIDTTPRILRAESQPPTIVAGTATALILRATVQDPRHLVGALYVERLDARSGQVVQTYGPMTRQNANLVLATSQTVYTTTVQASESNAGKLVFRIVATYAHGVPRPSPAGGPVLQ